MINTAREKENANKEAGTSDDKISTNSRLWLGLKDPRIVRVPRAFGGKDRHSKVSTIRGLRDRRVRLSVQTAIQLYDLQDKLGVNQPSKAVDWLLAAAQHEIDKLPPLPFPPANFTQLCQSFPVSEEATLRPGAAPSYHQTVEDPSYAPHRNAECADESGDRLLALFSNSKTNDDGDEVIGNKVAELSKFPNSSLNSTVGRDATEQAIGSDQGLGGSVIPYASYYHLEQANLNAYDQHQLGGNSSKVDAPNSFSMPSSLSLGPGSQLVLYASGATAVPSMFSPYMTSLNGLNISRQLSHAQPAASQDLRSSSVTFLQSGSTPIMVRPASLPRFSTGYHNPYDTHEN